MSSGITTLSPSAVETTDGQFFGPLPRCSSNPALSSNACSKSSFAQHASIQPVNGRSRTVSLSGAVSKEFSFIISNEIQDGTDHLLKPVSGSGAAKVYDGCQSDMAPSFHREPKFHLDPSSAPVRNNSRKPIAVEDYQVRTTKPQSNSRYAGMNGGLGQTVQKVTIRKLLF